MIKKFAFNSYFGVCLKDTCLHDLQTTDIFSINLFWFFNFSFLQKKKNFSQNFEDVNFRVGNMKLTHLFAWGKCKGHKCKQPCIKDMQRYKMSGTFSFVPMYCDQDISN